MEAQSKADDCSGSDLFMDVDGSVVCSLEGLQQLLQGDRKNRYSVNYLYIFTSSLPVPFPRDPPRVYKFDHQFPCVACTEVPEVPVVILYGQLGTAEFATFHPILSEFAANKEIIYIFRHFYKVPF